MSSAVIPSTSPPATPVPHSLVVHGGGTSSARRCELGTGRGYVAIPVAPPTAHRLIVRPPPIARTPEHAGSPQSERAARFTDNLAVLPLELLPADALHFLPASPGERSENINLT